MTFPLVMMFLCGIAFALFAFLLAWTTRWEADVNVRDDA